MSDGSFSLESPSGQRRMAFVRMVPEDRIVRRVRTAWRPKGEKQGLSRLPILRLASIQVAPDSAAAQLSRSLPGICQCLSRRLAQGSRLALRSLQFSLECSCRVILLFAELIHQMWEESRSVKQRLQRAPQGTSLGVRCRQLTEFLEHAIDLVFRSQLIGQKRERPRDCRNLRSLGVLVYEARRCVHSIPDLSLLLP